ncbi:MAG: type II toxin-antitoxin system ParD family antitoxin [Gammaproteobacteria bacterium]|nr:type II toxin-antitoxin system ParD family antitoxin [Kiritimatiellia bacterium]NKB63519.1 type II toxin-antitoxin system ParD family antitoxin [Gammaproteobacteria bacterium]
MTRTMTIDTGDELRGFVESLVETGDYKSRSEVVREGLRLLKEQRAKSTLETLRSLIDEGENSGDLVNWDVDVFLTRVRSM